MTVKDLISKLGKCDKNAEVYIFDGTFSSDITSISRETTEMYNSENSDSLVISQVTISFNRSR